ncbi:MAG: hypothetical protein KA015_05070 [Spirochaetes bacterium]|nr:hypothetical protein [Spirochaetota bacterium]
MAFFFVSFRADDDFWMTGNVFRVISQRDFSMFFSGMNYLDAYVYGLIFSISVSSVSFFLALKMRRYSFCCGRIWLIGFILSLFPAFFYSPLISEASYPFSLFFFINTSRYLFPSVMLLEKKILPRDIIFLIVLSASFSEFGLFHAAAGGYIYNDLFSASISMMPQKHYYSIVLFPVVSIISIVILWAAFRTPFLFLINRFSTSVNDKK